MVALRKESVDRNINAVQIRALTPVALRKESVDRNVVLLSFFISLLLSLSARRAWIEMLFSHVPCYFWRFVALRKESVDRNGITPLLKLLCCRRSPQGERG